MSEDYYRVTATDIKRAAEGFYCSICSPDGPDCHDPHHHRFWLGRGRIKCDVCGEPLAAHKVDFACRKLL